MPEETVVEEVVKETPKPTDGETPSETPETNTDETGTSENEVKEGEEPTEQKKSGVQKRIDELTAEKKAEKNARIAAEERARALEMAMQAPPQTDTAIPGMPDEPNIETFGYDYTAYREAMKKWAVECVKIETEAKNYQESVRKAADEFTKKRVAALSKYDDFDTVAGNPDVIKHLTQTMHDEVVLSDMFGDLAYYLGKNPAEAERISKLPAHQQSKEIWKIEAKLTSGAPTQTKTSSAPPPPPTVQAKGVVGDELDDNLPVNDWIKNFRKRRGKG